MIWTPWIASPEDEGSAIAGARRQNGLPASSVIDLSPAALSTPSVVDLGVTELL